MARPKKQPEIFDNWEQDSMSDNVRITDDTPLLGGDNEGRAITGGQSFDEFSATLPEDAASGFASVLTPGELGEQTATEEGTGLFGASEPAPGTKRIKMSKKMQKAMNKIKSKVGNFPILWFEAKAKSIPEWGLDEEEKAIITDSLEFVFEILNIEFQIETLDVTLTSIWWVIAYPILAIGMIFAIHSSAVKDAHPVEEISPDAK